MFRRSNSVSHIPVKLFGNSNGGGGATRKSRAQSASRLSQQTETNLLRPKRNSSLDKKVSLTKLTPLNIPRGLKERFTPGSASSNVSGRLSRVSPASGLKDRPTIQKLSTNKNWVSQQFAKLQNYIVHSSLFDPTVVNPNNIKPPTIKIFVYLVTVLLQQLFHNVKITQENYKEEVIKKLKVLHYPGGMTNSTLKSINTMHSWPQVVGMLGWLIDKIELKNHGTIDYSVVPDEEKYKYLLPELCCNFLLERYNVFNVESDNPDLVDELDQRFSAEFMETLGVNPQNYVAIKEDYDKKLEYRNGLLADVESLKEKNKASKSRKDKLVEDLLAIETADADEEAALDAELSHYKALSLKKNKRMTELRINIAKLEAAQKNQPFTYKDKMDLLKKNESLKNEVKIIRGRIEQAQEIKHEFDDKMSEEQEKLQAKVISWNRSLTAVCIQKPHLEQLLLKETGFHRKEFLEEIREVSGKTSKIEKLTAKEIEKIDNGLKKLSEEINSIKNELQRLDDEMVEMLSESKRFLENKTALEEDTRRILAKWEVLKKDALAMEDCPEKELVKCLVEENRALEGKKAELEVETVEFGEKAIAFFIDLHEQIDKSVKEMNGIMMAKKKQYEDVILKELEERGRLIAFMENSRQNSR